MALIEPGPFEKLIIRLKSIFSQVPEGSSGRGLDRHHRIEASRSLQSKGMRAKAPVRTGESKKIAVQTAPGLLQLVQEKFNLKPSTVQVVWTRPIDQAQRIEALARPDGMFSFRVMKLTKDRSDDRSDAVFDLQIYGSGLYDSPAAIEQAISDYLVEHYRR